MKGRGWLTRPTWAFYRARPDILALSYCECQVATREGALLPTYEYQCKSCGRAFEAVQAFSDAPLTTCETCGGTLKKIYGAVGIVFKGSGFYKTDSRSTVSSAKSSGDAKLPTNGGDAPASSELTSNTSRKTSSPAPSSPPAKPKDAATSK